MGRYPDLSRPAARGRMECKAVVSLIIPIGISGPSITYTGA